MTELDSLYRQILGAGLSSIRNAALEGDWDYCHHEAEHLHELPNMIGEENINVHKYYATKMRPSYVKWASREERARVREFIKNWYALSWRRIDEILQIESPSYPDWLSTDQDGRSSGTEGGSPTYLAS